MNFFEMFNVICIDSEHTAKFYKISIFHRKITWILVQSAGKWLFFNAKKLIAPCTLPGCCGFRLFLIDSKKLCLREITNCGKHPYILPAISGKQHLRYQSKERAWRNLFLMHLNNLLRKTNFSFFSIKTVCWKILLFWTLSFEPQFLLEK